METPIALIIFNRPDTIRRVFGEIARARPKKLFVIADGPRAGHPADAEKCAATRAIINEVDWPCEVVTDYSEVNLGCKLRPATGISRVFEQVEEAIILEDDCLPHQTFFRYCAELLERYRHDERVMMISGDNFQDGLRRTTYSYYFSRYVHCWGWASWRRAWRHFDIEIKLWPVLRETSWLLDVLGDEEAALYWRAIFDAVFEGRISKAWDYQWLFACWAQNGLAVTPEVNQVSNIGFGDDATHVASHRMINLPVAGMEFPLRHPPFMVRQREADQFNFRHVFAPERSGLYPLLKRKLTSAMTGIARR
ncbi:MAG TPA: hypothetical protein VF544_00490 [Pyrinomonadaceae bacterium]|jgi:hypothetical protein